MISNIYSKSVLQSSAIFARQAEVIIYDRLLPLLNSACASASTKSIDVHEIWMSTAMDFITAYIFGLDNSSNFLKNEEERKHWLSLYHSRKIYTFFNQELPHLTRFLRRLGVYLYPTWVDDANRDLEAWCKKLCNTTSAYIDQTPKDSDVGNNLGVMGAMVAGIAKESKSKGDESMLSTTTLRYPELSTDSEMMDHLAAGHETSGITLTYITWQLSRDLPLQDKLRKELLTLSPHMSLLSRSIPNPKVLDALPLLHAVIMETLRLHAAIPGGQPRMTPYSSSRWGNIPIFLVAHELLLKLTVSIAMQRYILNPRSGTTCAGWMVRTATPRSREMREIGGSGRLAVVEECVLAVTSLCWV